MDKVKESSRPSFKPSLIRRLIFLAVLLVAGAMISVKTSPLNFVNLFSKKIDDKASTERVTTSLSDSEEMGETIVDNIKLSLPRGFTIEKIVSGRGKLRMMTATVDGYLLVTEKDRGNVLAINTGNMDLATVISGLDTPSGLIFHDGLVWVAEETKISKYRYLGNGRIDSKEIVVDNLPAGGHDTRTIGFGPDNKLYVAVGSSCNVCEESDKRRAAITRYNIDGSGQEIFAGGLRNTVGFVWHPETNEMWGVDNGRDMIGDDLPPEEVNVIKQGKHYGWPYCYGRGVEGPEYRGQREEFCQTTENPLVEMQAHSAPLGLRFYTGSTWPERYQGNLFIAFHGSWNRSQPTGYKIVRVDKDLKVHDFIVGWLGEGNKVSGRPVDILFVEEDMYISDDHSGSIYKVSLNGSL